MGRGQFEEEPARRRERGARVEEAGSGKEFELRTRFRAARGGEEATVEVRPLLDLEGILMKQKEKRNRSKANLTGGKRKIFVTNSKKVVVYLLKVYTVKAAREKKEIRTQARR